TIGNTDFSAACRPVSRRLAGSVSACRNSRYESTWMASRNGTSRMERCLPKSLRMRFFSVNEYVVMDVPPLAVRAARPRTRGNMKLSVGSRWYCRHQHAISRYFRLPAPLCGTGFSVLQAPRGAPSEPWAPETTEGRGLSPPAFGASPSAPAMQGTAYLSSTVAPAASSSFLNFSA